MNKSIGILGVGSYIPPEVRGNDWWPEDVVARWQEKTGRRLEKIRAEFAKETNLGAKMSMEAIEALASDPFQGGHERRVMPESMLASDMETAAAKEAIERSGVALDEIDAVLGFVLCPDFINVPSACVVAANLGLRERTLAMNVDAVCNSFMMQLSMARGLIASGQARHVLLTQASAVSRLPQSGELFDNWWGDAGTAVVVGPVSEGRGLLAQAHHADGTLWGAFVCGVPGKRWYDDKCVAYSEDQRAHLDMLVRITDRAKQVVGEALADAGLTTEHVDFYACHQAFRWLREVTQKYVGLTAARAVDHFHWTGTVSAANLPLQLALGEKEGMLKPGDIVATFQGGTGMTWSSMVMRWGK
ncbi:MAG: 3-oxoacyl-[acyl-carrier-protein] synthase [Labilithrix sp.]|nr:3-oxoacyl-[acyl-carrier-protein] synthase [Labilithrix sp.]